MIDLLKKRSITTIPIEIFDHNRSIEKKYTETGFYMWG